MKRLFIDSDGTLFEWKVGASLYEVTQPGYFSNLKPMENVIEGIKMFHEKHPDIELRIATHTLCNEYALKEKRESFKKYVPFIKLIQFIPYGTDKNDYIKVISKDDYLLDDFSQNCFKWEEAGGIAIKLRNGINSKHGTWQGNAIHSDVPAWLFCEILEKIIIEKKECLWSW